MRIAIIGWGSLLWDLENLTPHVKGGWGYGEGPKLPLEFSRISPKRKLSLVVIIDPNHGAPCPTSFIESTRSDLDEAINDLAARERAPLERIGHAHIETDRLNSSNPPLDNILLNWLHESHFDACVWTDLPANFHLETGDEFSISAGLEYLKTLQGESLKEAKLYIDSAPKETVTPLRTALDSDAWWQSLPSAGSDTDAS